MLKGHYFFINLSLCYLQGHCLIKLNPLKHIKFKDIWESKNKRIEFCFVVGKINLATILF